MIGDWLALIFVVTIIYLLVRPRSQAAQTVDAIGDLVTEIVRRATDVAA